MLVKKMTTMDPDNNYQDDLIILSNERHHAAANSWIKVQLNSLLNMVILIASQII